MDKGENEELLERLLSSSSWKRKEKQPTGCYNCTHLIGDKIKTYFNNPEFSDVIIKIGEQQYFAHGFILSTWSEVFKEEIAEAKRNSASTSTNPDSCNKIKVQFENSFKVEQYITDKFINFFYTGEIKFRDSADAEVLINLAKVYDVRCLINLCEDFLVESLQQDNLEEALKTFEKAQDFQLDNLIQKCKLVFCMNFTHIPLLSWRKMKEDVVHEMIRSSFLVVENESVVLDKLSIWLDGLDDEKQKMLCLRKMIPDIRFVHMSVRLLMEVESRHGNLIEKSRPCAVQEALEMRATIAEVIQTTIVQDTAKKGAQANSKVNAKILEAVSKIPAPRIYWNYNAPGSPPLPGPATEIILTLDGSEKLTGTVLQDKDHIWRSANTYKWKLTGTVEDRKDDDEDWKVLLQINLSQPPALGLKYALAVSIPTDNFLYRRMSPSVACDYGSVNDRYYRLKSPIKMKLRTGEVGERPSLFTLRVAIYIWRTVFE